MKLACIFVLMLLVGIANATVPEWVQPGTSATYDNSAADIDQNGNYNNAVTLQESMQVQSVTPDEVTGIYTLSPRYPGASYTTQQWTYREGDVIGFARFWLDPQNPTASIKGENRVPLTVAGNGPFQAAGKTWDATTLQFVLPEKFETRVVYETNTGLVLEVVVMYPNKLITVKLRSANV